MEIIDQRLSTLANTTSTEQSSQMPRPLPNQDASSRTEQKNSAFDLEHIEEWILLRIMTSFQSMFIEHCRFHFFLRAWIPLELEYCCNIQLLDCAGGEQLVLETYLTGRSRQLRLEPNRASKVRPYTLLIPSWAACTATSSSSGAWPCTSTSWRTPSTRSTA